MRERDSFVVSQFLSMAKQARRSKLRLKPA